jgi:hypothetical protein
VDKDILPGFLGDESQALFIVPPFDFAFRHNPSLQNPGNATAPEPCLESGGWRPVEIRTATAACFGFCATLSIFHL